MTPAEKEQYAARLNQAAVDSANRGQLNEAKRLFAEILVLYPEHFNALYGIAVILLRNGEIHEAIDHLTKAVEVNSKLAMPFNILGEALMNLERFEEADKNFKKAISIKSDYTLAHFNRGICLRKIGDNAAACIFLEEAAKLAPNDSKIRDEFAKTLQDCGQFDRAVENFNLVISAHPRNAQALSNRGYSYFMTQKYDEAISDYHAAIQINPDFPECLNNLGLALKQTKLYDKALEHLRKAVSLDPHSSSYRSNLGAIYTELGRFDEASAALEAAVRLDAGNSSAQLNKAYNLARQGLFREAAIITQQVTHLEPENFAAVSASGNYYYEMGEFEKSAEYCLIADSINPDDLINLTILGRAFFKLGRFSDALNCYDRALKIDGANTSIYSDRGNILLEIGNFDDALASFNRALEISSMDGNVYFSRGLFFMGRGNFSSAASDFRRVLELTPEHDQANYFLAAIGEGNTPATAPAEYVKKLFDQYAQKFETHLKDNLEYRTPERLAEQFGKNCQKTRLNIVDLGCGTGLAGVAFSKFASRLIGVDLSTAMIAQAKKKNLYETLECCEILGSLQRRPREFDLVIAADVFVYIGDLAPIFSAVKSSLVEGGYFSFSVELTEGQDFNLKTTGRYGHSSHYIKDLAARYGFSVIELSKENLRKEKGEWIEGLAVLLGV